MNITASYQPNVFNYNQGMNKCKSPAFGAALQIEGEIPNELENILQTYAKNIGGDEDIVAFKFYDKEPYRRECRAMFHEVWNETYYKRDTIATSIINGKIKQTLFKSDCYDERHDMHALYKDTTNYLANLIDNKEKKSILERTLKPLTRAFKENCLDKLPINRDYIYEELEV